MMIAMSNLKKISAHKHHIVWENIMTKKDYTIIAKTIKSLTGTSNHDDIAYAFAHALKKDNPQFDKEKFLDACL